MRENPARPLKLLVLDDDPTFLSLFRQIGKMENCCVTTCESLEQLDGIDLKSFDVAIIDYYLNGQRGPDIAPYLPRIPIILVSFSDFAQKSRAEWDDSIVKFIPKKEGPWKIVDAAKRIGNYFEL